eukprot:CAMPEP_0201284376 /NCGR_PEP_ID=MMETSP1317-20130820/71827_1 /ASSEMBLY_ACC=CAM_ASM_000770 /TAXON_ID=187299 /ORGANISM="Undescribed Undescribed, Strain Undescribed" /LENGTH=307 /DNA_ID=CAMNT_0047604283 /DNA_START=64 /DNA_END=984 /DNA_ORIENTATION=-
MSLLICKSKDKPLKIALLLPGKIDDVSWNQAMYTGMKNMEKEYSKKVKVTYVEEVYEVADIEPAIRDFAAEGYDLIFGHGFQFMEPIINVAKIYPEVNFALGTGFKTLPNTAVYDVRLGDGGYLMGTLAGLMTETDKVGVVGGVDVSEIYRGHEAFKLAAKRVNPNIKIQELYTGDWRDAAKAKEGALSMYDAGVDIVWHSGDGIGLGVVDAAKEKDKYSMGNVVDQSVLAPNNVLSGVEYNWTPIIKNIVDDILDDNFTNRDNKYYWLTIENEGIQVTKFNKYTKKIVSKKVRNELKETRENIAKG